MRKLKFFSIFAVLVAAMLVSCKNNENNKVGQDLFSVQRVSTGANLEKQLEEINAIIKNGDIPIVMSREIINVDYFEELDKLQNIEYVCEFTNAIEQIGQKYGDKDNLTSDEELFVESLFEVLFIDDGTKIYDVLGFYLEQLDFLNIDKKAKEFLKNRLILLNDVFIYVNYNEEDIIPKAPQRAPETGYIWNCISRECYDCCMYHTLKRIRDGNNIIEIGASIYTAVRSYAAAVGVLAAGCMWDCHVKGNLGHRKDIIGPDDNEDDKRNEWAYLFEKYGEICSINPTLNIKISEIIK